MTAMTSIGSTLGQVRDQARAVAEGLPPNPREVCVFEITYPSGHVYYGIRYERPEQARGERLFDGARYRFLCSYRGRLETA